MQLDKRKQQDVYRLEKNAAVNTWLGGSGAAKWKTTANTTNSMKGLWHKSKKYTNQSGDVARWCSEGFAGTTL